MRYANLYNLLLEKIPQKHFSFGKIYYLCNVNLRFYGKNQKKYAKLICHELYLPSCLSSSRT